MTDAPTTDRGSVSPPTARWRREVRTFAELLALSGLAVAQPVFDVFGRAPDQFIFRGVERGGILRFALVVLLVPPLTAHVIEFVIGLVSERARRLAHLLFLGVFAAMFVTIALDAFLPRLIAIALAVAVAVLFGFAHERTRGARVWLAFLSPAPIVFAALFVLASQVAPLRAGSAGSLGAIVRDPAPTVVVVFDELPLASLLDADGDIDADLFPNFGRLAAESHWFREATTVSNYTWLALPALLTGMMPTSGTIPNSSSHPRSLFTLVGGAMPITSSEVVTGMCPASVCERADARAGGLRSLLGDVRDVLWQRLSPTDPARDPIAGLVEDDFTEPARAEGGAEYSDFAAVSARFAGFLDRLEQPGANLHYLHLLLPHIPFRHLPDGTIYPGPDPDLGRLEDRWDDQQVLVDLGHQRHLLQLQWTDALLGQIIDRLEAAGTWDSTNLVVVSDHGAGFAPEGVWRGLEESADEDPVSLADIAWVPFFVKTAGQVDGRVSDAPVRTVDLLPTIADVLDVDIPWETDGRSAFDGGSGSTDRVEFHRTAVTDSGVDPGPLVSFDRAAGHRELLERAAGRFAPPSSDVRGSDRIFRVGPRPDLWGREVDDTMEPRSIDVHTDSRADDVDPDSGRLPALFRATVDDTPVGTEVAVTVDDTIWATTVVYDDGDGPRVAAILPRRAFSAGANDLGVVTLP